MEQIQKVKSCADCAHYVHYYVKDNFRYRKTSCGCCVKRGGATRNVATFCDLWEERVVDVEDVKNSLKMTVLALVSRLENLIDAIGDEL